MLKYARYVIIIKTSDRTTSKILQTLELRVVSEYLSLTVPIPKAVVVKGAKNVILLLPPVSLAAI